MTTADLFPLRPHDTEQIGEVIDLLMQHCDGDQLAHFLADFETWYRLQGHRANQRERDAAEIELRAWQVFLDRLQEAHHEA